jgi:transcription termination factor Rho
MSEDTENSYDLDDEDGDEVQPERPRRERKPGETPSRMSLQELKEKSPADLLQLAEQLDIENAASMRKQGMMFAILKALAEEGAEIYGGGTLEVLQDGFGFLRAPESNYLAGPDDIYVSPSQIRRFGLRNGDTVEGEIRSPRDGERYFALLKVNLINFQSPEDARHKVHFDNLTPLYPDSRFNMELADPTVKDRTGRVIDIVAPLGKGQRALIVAPPRTGKTMVLHQPSRVLPDGPAHRRAARGSHRHAAHGEGRGDRLDLRRARHPPRAGR